MYAIEELTV